MSRFSAPTPRQFLLAVPGVVLLHNAEEALTMKAALPRLNAHLPDPLQTALGAISHDQFLIALGVVTILPFLLIPRVRAESRPGWGGYAMLALLATMALNVGSHVAMAVVLRGYAPGLVTSIGIILPVSGYGLTRAVRERWARLGTLALLPVVALLLHGPGLVGLMNLAGLLASTLSF